MENVKFMFIWKLTTKQVVCVCAHMQQETHVTVCQTHCMSEIAHNRKLPPYRGQLKYSMEPKQKDLPFPLHNPATT